MPDASAAFQATLQVDVGTGSPLSRPSILAVSPYWPYPSYSGGRLRVARLIETWSALGHPITYIAQTADHSGLPAFRERLPNAAAFHMTARPRASLVDKLDALITASPEQIWARHRCTIPNSYVASADIVVVMQPYGYSTINHVGNAMIVVDQQNIESRLHQHLAGIAPSKLAGLRTSVDGLKWRRYERQLSNADLLVFVSEEDRHWWTSNVGRQQSFVAPNGVDVYPRVPWAGSRNPVILIPGTLGYWPNLDATRWFARAIWPVVRREVPNAELWVVGSSAPADLLEDARELGFRLCVDVPDMAPYYEQAAVMVAAMRVGSGTRLKILEAFSRCVPVVATPVASEGIGVVDGQHLLLASNAHVIARRVVEVLTGAIPVASMVADAWALVERHYAWPRIARDYSERMEKALAGTAGAT